MRNKHLTISTVIAVWFGIAGAHAQTALSVAGGNACGTGGTASYTLGQMVYQTDNSATGSVAQGVQQGYAVSVISSQAGADGISCSVFPNPATDYLQLEVTGVASAGVHFQLIDINGRLLQQGEAAICGTRIELDRLAQASYYLRVSDGSKELKSFQIIKH